MAQALSEEEFQRMQAQLLELRTQNYQLSDELRKNGVELTSLRQRIMFLDKEFARAQKALSKSKRAQEVEVLLSENQMLQGKLHSQEDDFRLQNSTLLQELSKLCAQIEQLEQENQQLKESSLGPGPPSTASSPMDGELLRLQAENTALQRNVTALQERYEKEQTGSLGLLGTAGKDEAGGCGDPPGGPVAPPLLAEAELKWEVEKEEKRLLRERLQGLESSKQEETAKLQEEVAKVRGLSVPQLSEKLKKKQESFFRLQTEKEALYNDSRNKIEELRQHQEADLKAQLVRTQKLQQELQAANQSLAELREQCQTERQDHASALRALQDQIQTAKTQELCALREQTAGLATELQQCQAEFEVLAGQRDDLRSQLQESLRANGRLLEQLQVLGQEKEHLSRELEEARKSAEKRKVLLDEVAAEALQEKSRHKEELGLARLQAEKDVLAVRARYERELRQLHDGRRQQEEELRAQIREEKARTRELESLQQMVEELRTQLQSMEGAKGWFERRLKEAEEALEEQHQGHQESLRAEEERHKAELQRKEEEVQAAEGQLREAEASCGDHLNTIARLQQEVKDVADGQRILEKKGSAALKDLKRQLQLERKRADKLQERLQELLTNSKSRSGFEELVLSEMSSPSRAQTGDSSSVSSFSYREILREKEGSAGPARSSSGSPPGPARPAELSDEEVAELFERLAETQQEKWMLEEKVKHLEVSSASMAEDLCRKSAIIETYVMDSRIDVSGPSGHTDRSGLGSVLRDLVKPGDENLREMNKKLRNMLEEQLTKNMHLHKDMEVLSQEIVRLSKECVGGAESSPSVSGDAS
ncbi:GRIP1-associated protein 1 isoform X3 [Phascolarctos cinereus]|uniref:GRIP1-associated protein 1 isoform X3 n=1 Tax=Phascolarctos cinereus TaxID=38626 RepID=A0A6P5JFN8_PHACI|nr:GRIP1-associated protein 1 isoform X3 [Phascolarctos cinereus]